MNLLDPCPYAECAAIGEHHHEIAISEDDSPVWDGEFLKRHYYGK